MKHAFVHCHEGNFPGRRIGWTPIQTTNGQPWRACCSARSRAPTTGMDQVASKEGQTGLWKEPWKRTALRTVETTATPMERPRHSAPPKAHSMEFATAWPINSAPAKHWVAQKGTEMAPWKATGLQMSVTTEKLCCRSKNKYRLGSCSDDPWSPRLSFQTKSGHTDNRNPSAAKIHRGSLPAPKPQRRRIPYPPRDRSEP